MRTLLLLVALAGCSPSPTNPYRIKYVDAHVVVELRSGVVLDGVAPLVADNWNCDYQRTVSSATQVRVEFVCGKRTRPAGA